MGYYPIIFDLTGKKCLIVGGGEVALRKAESLLDSGASVTVIAPEVDERISSMNVDVILRAYLPGDVSDYALIFAATDDNELNKAISQEAMDAGIPVNVVDDPKLCSFIVPSIVRRGDLMIAVSTSGSSPSLSKRIRKKLEQEYVQEYAEFLDILRQMRPLVKDKYKSQIQREAAFGRLLECGILELLQDGKIDAARERALECI